MRQYLASKIKSNQIEHNFQEKWIEDESLRKRGKKDVVETEIHFHPSRILG